jgi:hypothetical protein
MLKDPKLSEAYSSLDGWGTGRPNATIGFQENPPEN